jgi:hypothetical protein
VSPPNDEYVPPDVVQTYVPPTTPLTPREPAPDNSPKVQISGALLAPPAPPSQPAQPAQSAPFAPQAGFAPQRMGTAPPATAPPAAAMPFAPQAMGGGAATPFAPQRMGGAPPGFAPQVMGTAPPGAAPGGFAPQAMAAATPFAPQVMGGAPGGFAPQAMAPQAAPAPAPSLSQPVPSQPPPGEAVPAPPAMEAPPAAPAEDGGLAASPWNTGNIAGFNRDLLPSAMAAPEPERAPASMKASARPKLAPEEPSRTPWIIVGVLVLVAIAGGVAVFQIRGRHGADGPIAVQVRAGAGDAPEDTAPTATASASATVAPIVRPVVKPRTFLDDPYGDLPPTPGRPRATAAPSATQAPHRLFGTEN